MQKRTPGIDTIGTLVLADLMPSDGRDMLKLDEKEQQNRGEQLYTDNSVFALFFEKLLKGMRLLIDRRYRNRFSHLSI
ncbi:MAG: hypothetical protein PUK05_02885 [Peptoniphilaceae bacterium]|nr:hypothetical protein [Peptoniphilaceae bacterium]MDY5766099.1 hypothetical protein [Peptoniphilaceae bacterium]